MNAVFHAALYLNSTLIVARPWILSNQGDSLHFTQSKNKKFLYAIQTSWPVKEIAIRGFYLDPSAKITMLGSNLELKWQNVNAATAGYGNDGKLVIEIPESLKNKINSNYAYTLKIQMLQ